MSLCILEQFTQYIIGVDESSGISNWNYNSCFISSSRLVCRSIKIANTALTIFEFNKNDQPN